VSSEDRSYPVEGMASIEFRAWKSKTAQTHWTKLLTSALRQMQSQVHEASRSVIELQRQAVLEIWPIYRSYAKRLEAFHVRTGRGKDTMYRRVAELRHQGLLPAA